jgi:hypothetical protein
MFDEILQAVKAQLGDHPDMSSLSPDQADAVHNEIANHINNAAAQGSGGGGLLGSLEGMLTSGSPVTSALEGGLINSLTSKFGLPPSITGAISGALPGLLQKFGGGSQQ